MRKAAEPDGDFLRLAVGESLAKAAGFVAFAWLARRLGPEGYGAVETAAAVALIGGLVVDGGLGPVAARAVALDPRRAAAEAARVPALRLGLAVACVLAVTAAVWAADIGRTRGDLVLLFALSLLAWPWNQNWLCQGLGRTSLAAAAQPLRMGVFALGALLLVRRPEDLLRVGWLEIVAVGALAAYFLAVQKNRLGVAVGLRYDRRESGRLAADALPVGLGQLLWAAAHALPVLLTALWVGGEQTAWIGAAVRVEVGLHAFVWLYFFALYPRLVTAAAGPPQALRPILRRAQWRIVALTLPIAVAGTLGSGVIGRAIFGDPFVAAGSTLAVALWALPVAAASGTSRFLLLAAGRQRLELAASAVAVLAMASGGALLIPRLGAQGAAAALVAGAVAHWLAAAWLARPLTRTRSPREGA
jgi:O-antigen/teichoic acid export membrane protein